jgi:hypothetical protein
VGLDYLSQISHPQLEAAGFASFSFAAYGYFSRSLRIFQSGVVLGVDGHHAAVSELPRHVFRELHGERFARLRISMVVGTSKKSSFGQISG